MHSPCSLTALNFGLISWLEEYAVKASTPGNIIQISSRIKTMHDCQIQAEGIVFA